MNYLLDTNICVHFFRGNTRVLERMQSKRTENLFISEMTLGELLYGAECSDRPQENREMIEWLCKEIRVLPLTDVWEEFARQKSALRSKGMMIEDADILIGSTAIVNDLIMVTENEKHIGRLQGITIDNWNK